jgi:hypothetical protein
VPIRHKRKDGGFDDPEIDMPSQQSRNADQGNMQEALAARLDCGMLLLLVMPWVFLAVDPNWIFSRLLRDFWIYYGYFRNFPDHLTWFNEQYYGSRLSVILPGALVYKLFPPLVANAVLHLGLYYVCVFSLYLALRRSCERAPALVAAVAMGANPAFLEAVGRDYVDGFGMAYFLIALLLITRADGARSASHWLFAAGTMACALVIANLTYIIFLPVLFVRFAIVFRHRPRAKLVRAGRMLLLGGTSLLVILCFVNVALVGQLWFLRPSIAFALRQSRRMGPNPFRDQLVDWLPAAGHLILPVLILSLWVAALGRRRAPSPGIRLIRASYGWQYLAACVVFTLVEFCAQGIWLQKYYYASLLYPLAYLALGTVLADLTEPLEKSGVMTLVAAAIASVLVGYAVVPWLAPVVEKLTFPAITLALLPIFCGTLTIRLGRPGLRSAVVLVVILGFAGSLCRLIGEEETNLPPSLRKVAAARHRACNRDRQSAYQAIAQATTAILSEPAPEQLRFWYREDEEHGLVFDCIASAFCAQQIFNVNFPTVTGGSVAPGARAIIFSSEPEPSSRARAAMRAVGLDIEVTSSRRITVRSIDFTMTAIRIFLPDQAEQQ